MVATSIWRTLFRSSWLRMGQKTKLSLAVPPLLHPRNGRGARQHRACGQGGLRHRSAASLCRARSSRTGSSLSLAGGGCAGLLAPVPASAVPETLAQLGGGAGIRARIWLRRKSRRRAEPCALVRGAGQLAAWWWVGEEAPRVATHPELVFECPRGSAEPVVVVQAGGVTELRPPVFASVSSCPQSLVPFPCRPLSPSPQGPELAGLTHSL